VQGCGVSGAGLTGRHVGSRRKKYKKFRVEEFSVLVLYRYYSVA